MTFAQAYSELEDKFKTMVYKDKHSHGIDSVFLPNVEPTGQVDYVLVGMEPGLSGCDKDFETAKKKIAEGKCENWGRCPQKTPWCSLFGSICAARTKRSITSPIWLTVR